MREPLHPDPYPKVRAEESQQRQQPSKSPLHISYSSGANLPEASFGVVRHPCARVLVERAATDVRQHAAREEQQSDTYDKHLHHWGAPRRIHNVLVSEMFPALRPRSRTVLLRRQPCHSLTTLKGS